MSAESGPDPMGAEERREILRDRMECEQSRRRTAEAQLAIAAEALRRLSLIDEMAGMGQRDGDPELTVRCKHASRALERIASIGAAPEPADTAADGQHADADVLRSVLYEILRITDDQAVIAHASKALEGHPFGGAYAQLQASLRDQVTDNARLSAELAEVRADLSHTMAVDAAELRAVTAQREAYARDLAGTQAIARMLQALAIEIIDEVSGWSRDPLDTDELIARWRRTAGVDSEPEEAAPVRPVLVTWDPGECTTGYIDEIADAVREQSGGRVIITMTDIADSDCHAVIGPRTYTDDEALDLIDAEAEEAAAAWTEPGQ